MTQTDRINGLVGNVAFKAPVRVATTANITLSGEQTIDDIAVVAGDRVLVKDQTDGTENGIYDASATAWSRSADFDGSRDVVSGTLVLVTSGTVGSQAIYQVTTADPITIDTTSLTFVGNASAAVAAAGIHGAEDKATPVGADEFPIADSEASWSLKKLTFTNLATYLSGLCTAGWTAKKANQVDSGLVTVASATTPDIFAAAGNTIDYTGTATCTGFAAAPKAGMQRRLICAAACLFTAGSNLLIEGIPSGTTITLAANAIVDVTAITTTQFKMTYSVSGSFTGTATGFTVNPTATLHYKHENGFVQLGIPYNVFTGTSNATSFTITGLPAAIQPAIVKVFGAHDGTNNSVSATIYIGISAGTITMYNGTVGSAFTGSGGKSLVAAQLTYGIA